MRKHLIVKRFEILTITVDKVYSQDKAVPLNKIAGNRKLKRYSVRLKVFAQGTGKLLGYAENLHTEGMKIKSKEPIPDKKEIQIWIEVSKEDEEERRISLTAYRIWSSFSDTVPRHYYSGLHFINPSEETSDSIQELINELLE